jgi:hypothetical protein
MSNATNETNNVLIKDKSFTSTDCMLTTIDNPYDPFEQFTSWFAFDVEKGYNTCGRLAKLVQISDEMSQKERDDEIDRAMNQMIELDFLNLYILVTPETAKQRIHN